MCLDPEIRRDLTADTLLPLLVYCLVQSKVKDLHSNIVFTSMFLPEPCSSSELAYTLASLQAAVGYLAEEGMKLPKTAASTRRRSFAREVESDGEEPEVNMRGGGYSPPPQPVVVRPRATTDAKKQQQVPPTSPQTPTTPIEVTPNTTKQPNVISTMEKKKPSGFLASLMGKK
jgi:hypothetical protein